MRQWCYVIYMNWDEGAYRSKVQEVLDQIEAAFSDVDPDVAECDQSLGSMTITLTDRSRVIISMQPSVRQIWLALAAKGTAYHFNYDATKAQWLDDKGRGVELLSYLNEYFRETCKLSLNLKS
jgi:CyaY protein